VPPPLQPNSFPFAQGQVLDSKEFYAPLITPYEAQLAFSPGSEWTGDYRLDFASLLPGSSDPPGGIPPSGEGSAEPRFSLLDGSYHGAAGGLGGGLGIAGEEGEGAVVARPSQGLLTVEEGKKHLMEVRHYLPSCPLLRPSAILKIQHATCKKKGRGQFPLTLSLKQGCLYLENFAFSQNHQAAFEVT